MQPDVSFPAGDRAGPHPSLASLTNGGTKALIEIGVHGRWSYRLGAAVSASIRGRLRERPTGMIIDLSDLADPEGASLALWLATRRACTAVRPPVALALCLPDTTTLDRKLRRINANRLPRFTTMPQARTAMTSRHAITKVQHPSGEPAPASKL